MTNDRLVMLTSWHRNVFRVSEFYAGNPRSWVNFPHKRPVMWALVGSLLLAWTRCWTNSPVSEIWDNMTLMWRHCNQRMQRFAKEKNVILYDLILFYKHCNDVIMIVMASQIIGVSIVCLTVCSGADHRKHQSSALLAFVMGIHQWQEDPPHKGPVTRKFLSIWWRHHETGRMQCIMVSTLITDGLGGVSKSNTSS